MEVFNGIKLGVEQAIEYEKGNLEAKEKTMKEIKCAFTEDQLKLVEIIASGHGRTLEDFVVETVMARATGHDASSVIEQLRKESAYRKEEAEEAAEELAVTQMQLERAENEVKRLRAALEKSNSA